MQRVDQAAHLAVGEMREFDILGKTVLIIRTEDRLFALGNRCSHLGCSLVNGIIKKGNVLMCQCHGSNFDMESGQVLRWTPNWIDTPGVDPKKRGTAATLPTYPLKEKDGHIYIDLRDDE